MKIKKYANGAWADLDKFVKKFDDYTDTVTALPLPIETSATDAVENYQVYGRTVVNLADAILEHANISGDGTIIDPGLVDPEEDKYVLYTAPVESGKTYTITTSEYDSAVVYAFYSTQPAYGVPSYNNTRTVLQSEHQATITAPITGWIAFRDYITAPAGMIVEGSAPAPIYVPPGTSGGVGEETENLVTETIQGVTINSAGKLVSSGIFNASIAPIIVGKTYTLLRDYTNSSLYCAFFTELPTKGSTSYDGNRETSNQLSVTITAPINGYVVVLNKEGKSTVAEGNTAIAYGYKIPLTITSDKSRESIETPLYIGDTQLGENEYLDYQNQKIYKNPIARWTCTFIPRTTPSGNKYVGFTLNWNMLNGAKITTFARMYLGNEVVNPLTEDTPNVIVEEDTLSARESGGTGANARGELGSSIRGYLVYNDTKYYTPTFNFSYDYVAEKGNFTLIFYSYEDEVTPPLPFPTLTTYLGENSIDVDTTTAPDKVVVEYKGWKSIGEPQIYDNGEWKDDAE